MLVAFVAYGLIACVVFVIALMGALESRNISLKMALVSSTGVAILCLPVAFVVISMITTRKIAEVCRASKARQRPT